MEFPSDISSNVSSCSFMQEAGLKDYSSELIEGAAWSSVSPYDFIPFDVASLQQGFANIYLYVQQTSNVRSIGMGIATVTAIFGAWKIFSSWNSNTRSEVGDMILAYIFAAHFWLFANKVFFKKTNLRTDCKDLVTLFEKYYFSHFIRSTMKSLWRE